MEIVEIEKYCGDYPLEVFKKNLGHKFTSRRRTLITRDGFATSSEDDDDEKSSKVKTQINV